MLYLNEGKGTFRDVTLKAGLGVETRRVGWGAASMISTTTGFPISFWDRHVYPETEAALPAYPYRTPPMLFRNLGEGRFEQIVEEGGPALQERHSTRGVGFGDLDNDGDIDIVMWNRNETLSLLRNDLGPSESHWLQLRLEGTKSTARRLARRLCSPTADGGKPRRSCRRRVSTLPTIEGCILAWVALLPRRLPFIGRAAWWRDSRLRR